MPNHDSAWRKRVSQAAKKRWAVWRRTHREGKTKVCRVCRRRKKIVDFDRDKARTRRKSWCKTCRNAHVRERYRQNPKPFLEKAKKHSKTWRVKMRLEVLSRYGLNGQPRCVCCGEGRPEFLTLDHANGDGAVERRTRSNDAVLTALRRARKKHPGYRTLCMNCNWSRGIRGYCPHERERVESA